MEHGLRARLGLALTLGLIAALVPAVAAVAEGPVYINEIQVSTTGSDWEFVELQGAAGTDLSDYTLLSIESDAGSSTLGRIDSIVSFAGAIPADGYFVAMSPTGAAAYGVAGDMAIADNTFENSTTTNILVTGFTGAAGDDVDSDNDGVIDSTLWTAISDALNVRDSASDVSYGFTTVGPDGSFLPSGAFRCPNAPTGGFDSNFLNFSSPDGTPGTENCPPPPGPVEMLIHEIQGSGFTSPVDGAVVIIEGVVVGDFQGSEFAGNQLGGFFVQEEQIDQDADPASSEGIFVFDPFDEVNVGDIVRITGTVDEFGGMTEITDVTDVEILGSDASEVVATEVALPVSDTWETVEGMLVHFAQDLYINEFFNYDRFGEIVLGDSRHYQPTQIAEPGSAEAEAIALANSLARITLDDGRTSQNPDPAIHPDGNEFTLTNYFRGGDILRDVTGVINYGFGLYRIQPTQGATHIVDNPRPTSPDGIKGTLRVASFNVLNFFTTLDNGVDDICGPLGTDECRGADDVDEYQRQLDKLVAGIIALDADIVGLEEVENDINELNGSRPHDAILTLVDALNSVEGAGTWAWIGELDYYNNYPVRNEIIYRPSRVTPVGDPVTMAHPAFDMTRPGEDDPVGRPPIAQTFTIDDDQSNRGDRRALTVVVNHFKSKGSDCSSLGDPDLGDGAGNCNLTRTAQSGALMDFVAQLQADSGDPDVLLLGDYNSYAMEDPIDRIKAGVDGTSGTADDFTDLLGARIGSDAYGYVFDGQLGTLDYALASPSLVSQVRGVTVFHINADEADIFDYDTSFKQAAQDALYEPLPYRVSDHDPVIVGIKLVRQDN